MTPFGEGVIDEGHIIGESNGRPPSTAADGHLHYAANKRQSDHPQS